MFKNSFLFNMHDCLLAPHSLDYYCVLWGGRYAQSSAARVTLLARAAVPKHVGRDPLVGCDTSFGGSW